MVINGNINDGIFIIMIKLLDLIKESQQEKQLDELGAKDIAIGAAMTAASMFGGNKAQSQNINTQHTTTTQQVKTTRKGTDIDGINGLYTSQFKFPEAFIRSQDKIRNLGVSGNTILQKLNSVNLDSSKMNQWNKYVDWLKSKGYSGNSQMDHITFSDKALAEYKKDNPNFWVNSKDDIKKVQTIIKIYREYTISVWKLGIDNAVKKQITPASIVMGSQKMEPNNPEDVKRVEDNYMLWAK